MAQIGLRMLPQPQWNGAAAYAYVSPIDGVAYHVPGHTDDGILFEELKKAGELIRELRTDVEALKAKLSGQDVEERL